MPDASDPVRVFIGSGEASLLERKTLIYSLRRYRFVESVMDAQ